MNGYYCTNDSIALFNQCWDVQVYSSQTGSRTDSFPVIYGFAYNPIQWDTSYYEYNTGKVGMTNGVYTHTIAGTTNPISVLVKTTVNGGASRSILVGCLLTNNIAYSISFGNQSSYVGPSTANVWTNISLTLVNTNMFPVNTYINVGAASTNGSANVGMTTLQIGNEATITTL